jgi:hypothetical protein
MRRIALLVVALLLGTSLLAPGIAAKGKGEIGFDLGWADLDDELGGGSELATIRGGYHATDRFMLEGQVEGIFPDCEVSGECADLLVIYVNGQYKFRPDKSVEPYILLGAGWADIEDDYNPFVEDPFKGQLVVQVGAGSRFYFGKKKNAAVRLEVTGAFFEDTSNANAQVGLLWRFGGGS